MVRQVEQIKANIHPEIAKLIEFSIPSSSGSSDATTVDLNEIRFKIEDSSGSKQYHVESKQPEGGLKGIYGFKSPLGFCKEVKYVVDEDGYRAVVRSKQPNLILWNNIRAASNPLDLNFSLTHP